MDKRVTRNNPDAVNAAAAESAIESFIVSAIIAVTIGSVFFSVPTLFLLAVSQ